MMAVLLRIYSFKNSPDNPPIDILKLALTNLCCEVRSEASDGGKSGGLGMERKPIVPQDFGQNKKPFPMSEGLGMEEKMSEGLGIPLKTAAVRAPVQALGVHGPAVLASYHVDLL